MNAFLLLAVICQQPGEFVEAVGPQPGAFVVTAKSATCSAKPIIFGNSWVEMATGTTSDRHLIGVHGFTPEQLRGLTQDQKNRLHGADHEGLTKKKQPTGLGKPVPISSCPNGTCPLRNRRR